MNKNVKRGESSEKHRPLAAGAWIIYDVGNTLFFAGIVGLFFPLWITKEKSGDDATVGFTLAIAMVIMLVVGPVVGAFSDQTGRRMPFLTISTLVCIGATLLLGGDNLTLAQILFALAVIAINTANIFYNGMLADVSNEGNRGKIGGLGVGIGYLGAITAVAIGLIFVNSRGYVFGFRAVGVLFLLVSTPLMVLLKERPRPVQSMAISERTRMTWTQLKTTLGELHRFPGLLQFLAARFWYTWAINTVSVFAVLYGTQTVGFSERKVELVLLVGILVAIPSALIWGIVVDRLGPSRVIKSVLLGWLLVLVTAVGIPWLGLPTSLWWAIGVASGVVTAGLWSADRPFMLRLTSPEYLGEFFGLHSMSGRLSAIAGPFTWGLISVTLGLGQPAALLSLTGCVVISYMLIRRVSDRVQTWSKEPTP